MSTIKVIHLGLAAAILIIASSFAACSALSLSEDDWTYEPKPMFRPVLKCRLSCFRRFFGDERPKIDATLPSHCKGLGCHQCWDVCDLLFRVKRTTIKDICNDENYCFDGCRQACKFYIFRKHREMKNELEMSTLTL